MDQDRHTTGQKKRLPSWLGSLGVVLTYPALLASTDNRFTMLDDESDDNAIAGRPMARAQQPFRFATDIVSFIRLKTEVIWPLWLLATHQSLFLLRLPANFSFIGAVFFTAKARAERPLSAGDAVPGEFRAATDPRIAWKQQFTNDVPVLAYRTDATWLD